MVLWVAAAALRSGASRVIVATDDQAICDTVARAIKDPRGELPPDPPTTEHCQKPAQSAPAAPAATTTAATRPPLEVLLTRPDHPTGTDRLAEVVRQTQAPEHQIIVNLQGDEPLMPPELLARVARRLSDDPQASVATAACAITDPQEIFSPHVVKLVCDQSGRALYFSRAPIPFWRDGWSSGSAAEENTVPADRAWFFRHLGLYAYRAGPLQAYSQWSPSPLEEIEKLEQLRWLHHGQAIAVEWLNEAPPAGVDTPQDLAQVRKVLSEWAGHSL
jgi:3-deoxy-manno-octulosonate cytidylyltransferase (CMP-KDO synthetase)